MGKNIYIYIYIYVMLSLNLFISRSKTINEKKLSASSVYFTLHLVLVKVKNLLKGLSKEPWLNLQLVM